jgi:hypothetical protein
VADDDFWDDLDSRITLHGIVDSRELFPDMPAQWCNERLPDLANCTRRKGHEGRHIAILDIGFRTTCSAWPGTHPPRLRDLWEEVRRG